MTPSRGTSCLASAAQHSLAFALGGLWTDSSFIKHALLLSVRTFSYITWLCNWLLQPTAVKTKYWSLLVAQIERLTSKRLASMAEFSFLLLGDYNSIYKNPRFRLPHSIPDSQRPGRDRMMRSGNWPLSFSRSVLTLLNRGQVSRGNQGRPLGFEWVWGAALLSF